MLPLLEVAQDDSQNLLANSTLIAGGTRNESLRKTRGKKMKKK